MSQINGSSITTYWVNGDGGSNSNNGTTKALAFDTIAHAIGEIGSDGDELRIMKTDDDASHYTISTALAPAWNNKEILITGANKDGEVDGTQVKIFGDVGGSAPILNFASTKGERSIWANIHFDALDDSEHCVETTSANHYIFWVNCRFSQATGHGVNRTGANYWSFINCRFDNNGGNGLLNTSTSFGIHYACVFDNNAGDGADSGWRENWIRCAFYNNGDEGLVNSTSGGTVVDCVFDNNTGSGRNDEGSSIQGCQVGNIYSNNGAFGIDYAAASDSVEFNSLFFNNTSGDYDSSSGNFTYGQLLNYTPGASGINPNFADAANFDFTPGVTGASADTFYSLGVDSYIKTYGTTLGNPGITKFVNTETISTF